MFSHSDIAHIVLHVQVLKETLVRHVFTFESNTDAEVIPKLAKYVFDKANEGEGMLYAIFLRHVMKLICLFSFLP